MLNLSEQWLEMPLAPHGTTRFHYVWLRDNCHCSECRHPDTKERILATASIPTTIAPTQAEIGETALTVVWNDQQHVSEYPLQWLLAHDYATAPPETDVAKPKVKLWGRELQAEIPRFDYQTLHSDESAMLAWCEAVRDIGLTVVENAPLVEGEIERFAETVAVVRETIYDRLHNVRATPGEYNAYNVASTTLELKPHTDMPNYNNPPGVQMFHFLVNESEGGESTAVDGFKVAADLLARDPQAYQTLATTPVEFRMFSSRGDIQSSNPLLTLDHSGELNVFRFSNQLAQPARISAEQMSEFYRAYQLLGQMIEDPSYKIEFRMKTGDIMVTNNLRVLHGRNSYDANSGARHLQLSYMDFDDVLSRIRMLKQAQSGAS